MLNKFKCYTTEKFFTSTVFLNQCAMCRLNFSGVPPSIKKITCVMALDKQSAVIIFESLLYSFEMRVIFRGIWSISEYHAA